jgi:hypothetical protein
MPLLAPLGQAGKCFLGKLPEMRFWNCHRPAGVVCWHGSHGRTCDKNRLNLLGNAVLSGITATESSDQVCVTYS